MANDLTSFNGDDGFGEFRRRSRHYAKWDDVNGWQDRDGVPLPDILVLLGIYEFYRRWTKDGDRNIPTDITDKPLPDLAALNADIPAMEWPTGRDGKKEPPFKHYYGFTLVSPVTGAMYSYSNSTWGASQLYDDMDEAVTSMRAMRGTKCVPIVTLSQRPMNSKRFGKVMRPHLEIIDWKTLGGDGNAIPPQAPTPQLTNSSATPAPGTQAAKSKKPIPLSDYTLATMGDVKPVSTAEFINDSLDDLSWNEK